MKELLFIIRSFKCSSVNRFKKWLIFTFFSPILNVSKGENNCLQSKTKAAGKNQQRLEVSLGAHLGAWW